LIPPVTAYLANTPTAKLILLGKGAPENPSNKGIFTYRDAPAAALSGWRT